MDNSTVRWVLSGEGMWQPEEGDQPHTLLGINKQHQPPQREAEEGSEEVRWQKRGRELSKMRQCTGVWRHGSSSGSQAGWEEGGKAVLLDGLEGEGLCGQSLMLYRQGSH